jgi:DNA-binding Lrp family transcriptional regulator
MKRTELMVISELMKNSRRSDRDLAKAIGVSQPTVSRTIKKLEKEGVLREYTAIPDFTKIGFKIMSVELAKVKGPISEQELEKTRRQVLQPLMKESSTTIIGLSGTGCNADKITAAFHEDYSAYTKYRHKLEQHPLIGINELHSFLIDLTEKNQFLPLTFSFLADYIKHRIDKENLQS